MSLSKLIKNLSSKPGVYQMLNSAGEVLYVGKAKNLKKRVSSYFNKQNQGAKTQALVRQIEDIIVTITASETEALLLESNLIKSLRPKYNVLMRDDKSYPYLIINTEHDFPSISFLRAKKRPKRGKCFGPYPSVNALKEAINILEKVFKIRNCRDSYFNVRSRPCLQYQIKRCTAPCVNKISKSDYALSVRDAIAFLEGKCLAIIESLEQRMQKAVNEMDFEYAAVLRDQIKSLRQTQEQQAISKDKGDVDILAIEIAQGLACVQCLKVRDGNVIANQSFFPKLPRYTDDSDDLHNEIFEVFIAHYYLQNKEQCPPRIVINSKLKNSTLLEQALFEINKRKCSIKDNVRGLESKWLKMAIENAQLSIANKLSTKTTLAQRYTALQSALKLEQLPMRMECFDISHTMGEATIASCVVFNEDGPLKSDYRRFNIEGITGGDDYAAMKQALTRRYKRLKKESAKLPDILFIDGGKGQVTQARQVFSELGIEGVCLIGIAKGPERKAGWETLILSDNKQQISLPMDSPALHLIQHIRDEAHRFAITAHRQKRHKTRFESGLETIEGIGAKKRQALLRRFGGIQEVAKASIDELLKVKGISKELAMKIIQHFQD
jgi:excinuclease ABC subunit C